MSAEAMYEEIILDYYRHPQNFGTLEKPDIKAKDVNISCGDEVEIQIAVKEGKIAQIMFHGKGCAISQAATSMLTEHVQGVSLEKAAKIAKQEVLDLLSIPISPMRLKCALLGFKVLKVGLYSYLGEKRDGDECEDE